MIIGLRELLFLVVLIAMPVSAFWFVFGPQNADIEAAREEIARKEEMLETLARVTARSDDLIRLNKEIAASIAAVEARLPDNKEVEVILEQVATLARESRLTLTKVRSGTPIPSAKYMEQPLDMVLTGDFDDYYAFLLRVEELDRITRMPEMRVKKLDDVDGAIESSFTLSIYFDPGTDAGNGGEP